MTNPQDPQPEKPTDPSKPLRISAKDLVYVEIDDEITSLVDKLKLSPHTKVYLVIPVHAILFESSVNLRILSRFANELNKEIYIITSDPHGRRLATEAGFNIIEKIKGLAHPPLQNPPKIAIKSLKKTTQKNQKTTQKNLTPQKISLAEIIESERQNKPSTALQEKIQKSKAILRHKAEEIRTGSPRRFFILLFAALAISLFFFVIYLTLPSATIHVEPKYDIIEKTTNLIFTSTHINPAETLNNSGRNVPFYEITETFEKTLTFNATEKIFTGSHAVGEIIISNRTAKPWLLIANTRFQTEEGLVFRTPYQITVPSATISEEEIIPGTLKIKVTADTADIYNDIIGDRGNIPADTPLTIPALSDYSQKQIYAHAAEDFTGGVTDYYTIISESDLAAAEESTYREMEASAREEFKSYIKKRNQLDNSSLRFFEAPESFQREILEVSIPTELVGTQTEKFEVTAKMRITGLAYDHATLLSILERELSASVHPDKLLTSINTEGIILRPLPETYNQTTGRITVIATIEGVETWNLNPESLPGETLLEKIRSHTVNKSIADANAYIRNLRQVRSVKISIWPFWASTLPNTASRINLEVIQN